MFMGRAFARPDKGNDMESFAKFIMGVVVFILVFSLLTDIGNGTTVEMKSDSNSATMVTTDYFGNKKTCTTMMVYDRVITHCD